MGCTSSKTDFANNEVFCNNQNFKKCNYDNCHYDYERHYHSNDHQIKFLDDNQFYCYNCNSIHNIKKIYKKIPNYGQHSQLVYKYPIFIINIKYEHCTKCCETFVKNITINEYLYDGYYECEDDYYNNNGSYKKYKKLITYNLSYEHCTTYCKTFLSKADNLPFYFFNIVNIKDKGIYPSCSDLKTAFNYCKKCCGIYNDKTTIHCYDCHKSYNPLDMFHCKKCHACYSLNYKSCPSCNLQENKEECSICLQQIDDSKNITTEKCKHRFHQNCIDKWKNNNNTCPMCREELLNIPSKEIGSSV
jgi:Ring finger domain